MMSKAEYDFGEKAREGDKSVWQSPKYKESKQKAIEMIEAAKYHLSVADFWILKNESRQNDGIIYSGLIISHNGCLKINDAMDIKFDASCVTVDKDGWGGSLVYTYCSPAQGLYEVGEASAKNCKNAYPYAMAYKRMFDRVVLKLSKLAYAGIYSEAESDEFKEPLEKPQEAPKAEKAKEPTQEAKAPQERATPALTGTCAVCGKEIKGMVVDNKVFSPYQVSLASYRKHGKELCEECRAKVEAK